MDFHHAGCKVSAICPAHHYLHTVTGIEAVYPYRALSPTGSLQAAIRAANPDLIVPCDDGAAWHLHELCASQAEFRPLIERSLGPSAVYPVLSHRAALIKTAAELGIRVPCTELVASPGELDNLRIGWPGVLKIDGTWGGEGVAIVRHREEARKAYATLLCAAGSARAWRRFLVNRHPLSVWQWRHRKTPAVIWQSFVAGRQATSMFACRQGELLGNVAAEVLASRGPTGAADSVRLIENSEMERAARLLAQRFQLSGLHGLDFILEEGTGAAFLIEMNARATQLGHLNACPRGSLADALAATLTEGDAPKGAGTSLLPGDTVALFPAAWKADPENPLLTSGYHDVPWQQPALVRELLEKPRPERLMLSRLLNFLSRRESENAGQTGSRSGKDQSPLAS